MFNRFLVFYY